MNIQGWFPLGLIGLISLLSEGFSSLLQHHNSKASILQHSAFFMVQLSHLYMITGKTTALTIRTFVGRVVCLLFNTLSRFVMVSTQWLYVYWICIYLYVYMNIKIITVEVLLHFWLIRQQLLWYHDNYQNWVTVWIDFYVSSFLRKITPNYVVAI